MNTQTLTSLTMPAAPANPDVELRLLETDDAAAVLAVFAGLGARSRALRFLVPKARLTDTDVRQLTAVDRHDHVAVLASTTRDGRPVGIARFTRDLDDPGSADVAVAVVDDWQRRGVGTALLGALATQALEVGVRHFTVLVSLDNVAVLSLLRLLPGAFRVAVDRWTAEYVVPVEKMVS